MKDSVLVYRNTVYAEPPNSTETLFLPNYRTETEIRSLTVYVPENLTTSVLQAIMLHVRASDT